MIGRPRPAPGTRPEPTPEVGRLAAVVARRHGLTAREAERLTARTLSALVAQAQHLLALRDDPDAPPPAADPAAGRRLAAESLSGHVRGADPDTTAALGRLSSSASDRRDRINARLSGLGMGVDDYDHAAHRVATGND